MGSAVLAFALMYAALLFGGPLVRYGLYAALFHELGHIAVYIVQRHRLPQVKFAMHGVSIKYPCQSARRDIILLFAGVAVNLALVAAFAIKLHFSQSYSDYFVITANLAVAVFNLLPLSFTDGGRLLILFVPVRYLWLADVFFTVTSCVFCLCVMLLLLASASFILQISLCGVIIITVTKTLADKR